MKNFKMIEAREVLGLTQNDLAEKIETTQGTISKYENGDCYPRYTRAKKIAEVLNISVDEILANQEQTV